MICFETAYRRDQYWFAESRNKELDDLKVLSKIM